MWSTALGLLACASLAQAHDGAHNSAGVGAASAFVAKSELATLDGSRFEELATLRQPLLINFWGVDCPPCIAELPALAEFAKQQSAWTVVLVSTDSAQTARDFLRKRPLPELPNLLLVKASANPRASLRAAGNAHGALPYTLATKRSHADGTAGQKALASAASTCFAQAGMLEASDFKAVLAACSP